MSGVTGQQTPDGEPGRAADWSFGFDAADGGYAHDGVIRPEAPRSAAIVDGLEFAKSTLQHELAGIARTSLHLQSLLRRAHHDGMTADEVAVHAGLSIETVRAVLSGEALVDQLFGSGAAPRHGDGRPPA